MHSLCAAWFATGGGVSESTFSQQGSREGCSGGAWGWTGARLHAWSTPMLSEYSLGVSASVFISHLYARRSRVEGSLRSRNTARLHSATRPGQARARTRTAKACRPGPTLSAPAGGQPASAQPVPAPGAREQQRHSLQLQGSLQRPPLPELLADTGATGKQRLRVRGPRHSRQLRRRLLPLPDADGRACCPAPCVCSGVLTQACGGPVAVCAGHSRAPMLSAGRWLQTLQVERLPNQSLRASSGETPS